MAADLSHDAFVRGARLFDDRAFFEAHEAWEERWLVETDVGTRRFFQGLIQIAAGFHKLVVSRSSASASRLLARGLTKLDACPDEVAEFGLTAFRDAVRASERAVALGILDASSIPRIGR
jgi:predicted metal-dependent hydrolase